MGGAYPEDPTIERASGCEPWPSERPRRSAELLRKADEEPLRPADIAEPIGVFVLDDIAADELRTVLPEPGERLVDVVDGEHDAQVA